MATLYDVNNPSGRLTTASTMRGLTVFNTAFEELGRIEDVIIEEPAGRIAFVILQQGGFLGIGAHHYPLRWENLRFDVDMDGYIADVDRDVGEGAPSYTDRTTASWDDEG
jgi:sporulation protein YlmC with PRC-barrel domain